MCGLRKQARQLKRRACRCVHSPTHTLSRCALQGAVDSEGKPVDAAFYRTFWGLQSYFRWGLGLVYVPSAANTLLQCWLALLRLLGPAVVLPSGLGATVSSPGPLYLCLLPQQHLAAGNPQSKLLRARACMRWVGGKGALAVRSRCMQSRLLLNSLQLTPTPLCHLYEQQPALHAGARQMGGGVPRHPPRAGAVPPGEAPLPLLSLPAADPDLPECGRAVGLQTRCGSACRLVTVHSSFPRHAPVCSLSCKLPLSDAPCRRR